MNTEQKAAEYRQSIIDGVEAKYAEKFNDLNSKIEELEKKSNRFEASEAKPVNALAAAASKVANAPELKAALEARSKCSINIGQNPYELEKKSIVYNPGSQTVSGDIRQVLANLDRPGIIPYRLRPLAIRDLLNVVPTTAKFINYVRNTGITNNAAYVAMANLKPESAMDFVVEHAIVETIAHTLTVPLQMLRDVNSFEPWLTSKLVTMQKLVSEYNYIWGDGTSPNIRGIMNFTGIQTLSQSSLSGYNKIDTFRAALNKISTAFFNWADHALMHPDDCMEMELEKDGEDRYLWPLFGTWATSGNGSKSLFGVPVTESQAMVVNRALIGNFREGVTLYQREDVNVRVSFDTLDYFQRNLAMVRVESDECIVPEDAKAFVDVTWS